MCTRRTWPHQHRQDPFWRGAHALETFAGAMAEGIVLRSSQIASASVALHGRFAKTYRGVARGTLNTEVYGFATSAHLRVLHFLPSSPAPEAEALQVPVGSNGVAVHPGGADACQEAPGQA